MKRVISIILFILTLLTAKATDFVVIDGSDGTPLPGATIIGKSGIILGITDGDGKFKNPTSVEYPLTVRNIGYDSFSIPVQSDTIRLQPAVYSLNEVVVNSAERPIMRVICYAREYSTGATATDSMQLYSECMLEAFIKDDKIKVKGYKGGDARPKVRNRRRFARYFNHDGLDSIFNPAENDDITMLSWIEFISIPTDKYYESRAIAEGSPTDTIPGKYGPSHFLRKNNGIFSLKYDYLSEFKEHSWSPMIFKLIGMTMTIENMSASLAFLNNDTGVYSIDDFIYSTFSFHILAEGKIFKKIFHTNTATEMDAYIELYPVSITYLTPEEYKELRSDKSEIPFRDPLNLQPLPPAVESLKNRFDI